MANWINNTVDADKPETTAPINATSTVVSSQWETSTPWGTVLNTTEPSDIPTPTPDVTKDITAPSTTKEAIEGGIEGTVENINQAPIEAQNRKIEEAVQKDEALVQTKEFAAKRVDIIEEKDKALAETEAQIKNLAQQRAVRDAEELTKVKNKELVKADLIIEEQRLTNKLAETEAEQKIEVAKQQATWAFNKLGLGFSSGIINEVQRIATQGANKLALLKVTWAKFLSQTQIDVAKLEQSYASEINRTVDKYTDISISNKQNSIKRLGDVQNSLLLNNRQKETQINDIKSDFKTSTRKIEDDLRNEQERMADKLVKQTAALEAQVSKGQDESKVDAEIRINNWDISRLLDADIIAMEKESGLPLWTLKAEESLKLNAGLRGIYDNIIGKDYAMSNVSTLIADARTSMWEGKSMSEAISFAVNQDLKTNEAFKRKQRVEKAQDAAKIAKAKGSSSSAVDNEAARKFVEAWGSHTALAWFSKAWQLEAATKKLEEDNAADKEKVRQSKLSNTNLQKAADKSLKTLQGQVGVFEWNDEATSQLENTFNTLQDAWFNKKEIINKVKGLNDIVVEEEDGKLKIYNNSKSDDNLIFSD